MLGKQKRALVNKIGAGAGQLSNTAHTRHRPNVVVMLGQRRRRRPNITTTLDRYLVFAGNKQLSPPY